MIRFGGNVAQELIKIIERRSDHEFGPAHLGYSQWRRRILPGKGSLADQGALARGQADFKKILPPAIMLSREDVSLRGM